MFTPSISTIFDRSGSNAALQAGSVKLVVVDVAGGRHRVHCTPSGL
jgi:hypothetical protein